MKKLAVLIAVVSLFAVVSPAWAFSLLGDYTGPVKLHFADWTVGRQYTYSAGTWTPEGAARGLAGGALTRPDGVQVAGDGVEDSWGLIRLLQITDYDDNPLWSQSGSEQITGVIYGYDDVLLRATASGVQVGQVAGGINLYLDNTPDFAPGAGVPSVANRASDPWKATDGTLFLSLVGVPANIGGGVALTRFEDVNQLQSPFSGQGYGYLDVTGGAFASLFNSDMGWDVDGDLVNDLTADFYARFVFDSSSQRQSFDAYSSDPAWGGAVPEPGSMLLLGLGLAGLVGKLRRRKVA
jgi:hypothetical protein